MKYIALLMLFSVRAFCQSTGAANTKGNCSPAITGHGNTINIKTCGIEQGDEFRKLLKSIASSQQLDTATILKKLDECLHTMADRHLTDEQKKILVENLSQLRGRKINIASVLGDKEGKGFAADFVEVFRRAEWTGVDDIGQTQAAYTEDPVGIVLQISKADFDSGHLPADVEAVRSALVAAKIPFTGGYNASVLAGTFELRIGIKPPLPPAR